MKVFFGAVKLTKSVDADKNGYSGYGIGFDARLSFSLSNGTGFVKKIRFSRVGNSSSDLANNKKKNNLILRRVPTDVLDNTTITEFCLSLHYNGSNKFLC